MSNPSSRYLRPAVQHRFSTQMLPGGKQRDKIINAARKCDLLLIAGVPLQHEEIMDLVHDIAEKVHERYGGVVYISDQPIKGRTTKYCIDFHLQIDVDECAERIMEKMNEPEVPSIDTETVSDLDHGKSDIWFEHLVRQAPRLTARVLGQPAPRMAMIIYFLDQFWPQAKHLRDHVLGRWNGREWPCHVQPVKLENICEQRGILEDVDSSIDAIVGCMNKKLTPAFLIPLIGKLTMSIAGEEPCSQDILDCWLSDGVVCNHTDLIYLERGIPATLWLFSPFGSRPLGKELPHLLVSCTCKRGRTLEGGNSQQNRKIWKVSHDAKHGRLLKDITVKATCSS
ncbi:hypothetical protein FRC11_008027, partial [Ceratobasidium sp. 423]